MNGTVGSASDP